MPLKAKDIFVPGAFPDHTYVERGAQGLEAALRDALDTQGQLVSLSGPSKAGKTVLVEKVVGRELLITISGATIKEPNDVWTSILDWMDVPSSATKSTSNELHGGAEVTGHASVGIPLVAKGGLETAVKVEGDRCESGGSAR
jgi:hypothetical protein